MPYRIVVFPAASRPTMTMRISLKDVQLCMIWDRTFSSKANVCEELREPIPHGVLVCIAANECLYTKHYSVLTRC